MGLPLDYETLRIIWWLLLGVLLIGFALTDGFDLGVATILPFVAKGDDERRLVINAISATWEGNQVWFILGGGAIFAAWPFVYAVSFSGFYLAMFLVLAALILRPVAFKYRSKRPEAAWRARWDWALIGVPFRLDSDLRSFYEGGLLGLFTPFALVAGLLSVATVVMHGAAWLTMKIERGPVQDRARRFGQVAAALGLLLFAVGGVMVATMGMGFAVEGAIDTAGPSNPHIHEAIASSGAWLHNYTLHPWTMLAPVLGLLGPVLAFAGIRTQRQALAFGGSSVATIGIISTVGLAMFPFILPSSIDAGSSLTVWNASSSHLTLFVMLVVTVVLLPLVLLYTAWAYKVMFGRVTMNDVATNPDFY
jgi:cytochrome d ubiquinol oxidase subunit II